MIEGMDDYLSCLLDVTIVYPEGVPTFWEFLQGRCPTVIIEVTPHQVPTEIYNTGDAERRAALGQWIKELWLAKDRRIESLLSQSS